MEYIKAPPHSKLQSKLDTHHTHQHTPRNMNNYKKLLLHICSCSYLKLASVFRSIWCFTICFYRYILLRMNAFSLELVYFVSLSWVGYMFLKSLSHTAPTSNLDMFFMSVSATTVSSMSTVEMEVFSDSQLVVITILMFIGSEVFTSMVGLHLRWILKLRQHLSLSKSNVLPSFKDIVVAFFDPSSTIKSHNSSTNSIHPVDGMELRIVVSVPPQSAAAEAEAEADDHDENQLYSSNQSNSDQRTIDLVSSTILKYNSIKFLGYVVLGYLLFIHVLGVALVTAYIALYQSAKDVLKRKHLNESVFIVFTTVSTFASCGFVPTNENMVVFIKNSGLLWILIPQALLGNTLFPSVLRLTIWLLGKYMKKDEAKYLMKNTREIGYLHLLPGLHSWLLVVTVVGFIFLQWIMICAMEWDSSAVNELGSYQKLVAFLFQVVNARHTGETVLDISIIAPAILVMFVAMMYLPPYTSFLPKRVGDEEELEKKKRKNRTNLKENMIFSQLTYLLIFIILICISERKKMKDDPLNFSVLNIVIEVISAYGNVGLTTGYSCDRRLRSEGECENKWYGFAGRWSSEGKLLLIFAMFFGRLKKFNMNGGKAWKLL